jgi:hypothetical protein
VRQEADASTADGLAGRRIKWRSTGTRPILMGVRYCAANDRSGSAGPARSLNASNSAGL